MFYDTAKIYVKAGDGGNGVVAFRREKYVPLGGPSGGDGGSGGSLYLVADEGLRTLVDFHYRKHYRAERGEHGQGKNMHGRRAPDLELRVPLGTMIKDAESGALLADLSKHGARFLLVRGGRGGKGNARFTSAANRAPAMAEKGEPGEERWVLLELKLLADVGLVGYPNAGKSTLIAKVSAARPKIAPYPFTTTVPNLGLVHLESGDSFVMADIPGLIAGAHTGAGLGHQFLRHVERTRILIHVVDGAGTEGRDPVNDVEVIYRELEQFDPELARRPTVLAVNKMDMPTSAENLRRLQAEFSRKYEIYPISALSGEGVKELMERVWQMLSVLPPIPEQPVTVRMEQKPDDEFTLEREEDGGVRIRQSNLERLCSMTDFSNEQAIRRFQEIMRRRGIDEALRTFGVKAGDTVRIGREEFTWEE